MGELHSHRLEVCRSAQAIGYPHPGKVVSGQTFPEKDDLLGSLMADQFGQKLRNAQIRGDAYLAKRRDDDRRLGYAHQITREDEGETAAYGISVDHRYDGFGARAQRHQSLDVMAIGFSGVFGGVLLWRALAQIAAAGEVVTRAPQNDHMYLAVKIGLFEALGQKVHHAGVDGVFLLRLVEGDDGNAVVPFLHVDHVVFHNAKSLLGVVLDCARGTVAGLRRIGDSMRIARIADEVNLFDAILD